MANVTVLPGGDGSVVGFDTGPGNTLMDAWVRKHKGEPFDREGQWAASGKPDEALVQRMLADPYFSKPPPKSTGFEHFSLQWLAEVLTEFDITAADVQASLLELTVRSIGETVDEYSPGSNEIAVCGGGVNNEVLMRSLRKRLAPKPLISTATLGVDPEWVEAAAFAWLASRTVAGKTGNLPSVTGASRREVLGAIYPVT